jgi:ribosome recycling factor
MEVKQVLNQTRDLMGKSLDFFGNQLSKVRTGRASASLVENVKADYYGSPTHISQMATISVPDARTILIQPWDRTSLTPIEKAIQSADLGFNPQNDGIVIRIAVPPLTVERRKEFVKISKKYAEESKIAVRNIRREQMEVLKKSEKDKQISEDDQKRGEDEIQKITDGFIKDIDKILAEKEKALMED